MRYKIAGVFLLFIFALNLYAIISDISREKEQEPIYYYLVILAALVLGVYFLFFKKRRR